MSEDITIHKVSNNIENLIITGMIVSDRFLKEIQIIYSSELMHIPFARTVAGWCLEYWKKFQKAPGIHIQDIYNNYVHSGLDEDMSELIKAFLSSISHEYERAEQFNVEYLLAQAEARFRECSLKNLTEDVQAYLSQGQVLEAEKALTNFKRVERPQSKGINPFTDREAIYRAIEKRELDILFELPEALGQFLGPIERSTFTGILAPEKRGKSYFLMQLSIWAIKARCNVASFVIGDMSQNDIVRRINTNTTRTAHKHHGEVLIPVLDCLNNQTNTCTRTERTCSTGVMYRKRGAGEEWGKLSLMEAPNYIPCTICKEGFKGAVWFKKEHIQKLHWKHAWNLGKKIMSRAGGKEFKLITYPRGGINVPGIEHQLDLWEEEGFVADVIIIDYADNLAPIDSKREERLRQGDTWGALRALSQKRYCAVITATQSDTASYSQKTLREDNFSESKSKYSHVTAFWTLNQIPEEKEEGVIRIGSMFVREDKFNVNKQCTVLQCLDIGRPYITSFL